MNITTRILLIFLFSITTITVQSQQNSGFSIIPLGVEGGYHDGNLTSYLFTETDSAEYLLLDAGSIFPGLQMAADKKLLEGKNSTDTYNFIKRDIKACLITHAHLDHITGLSIISAEDSSKTIYGTQNTLHYIQKNIFNWEIWPNVSDGGVGYALDKYHFTEAKSDSIYKIANTNLSFQAFPLSHGNNGYPSTAFLINNQRRYFLFIGDTGADRVEKCNNLSLLWEAIAPLIINHTLSAMVIECSYSDEKEESKLYGHLTPALLLEELNHLAEITSPSQQEDILQGTKIFINHIKPIQGDYEKSLELIRHELAQHNNLNLQFYFPVQGEKYEF